MPGYDQFAKMQPLLPGAVASGAINALWAADGRSFTYSTAGKAYRFDLTTMKAVETGDAPAGGRGGFPGRGAGGGQGAVGGQGAGRGPGGGVVPGCPPEQVERGRQASCLMSPHGVLRAQYRDRNLWIVNVDGTDERQVTAGRQREGPHQVRHRQLGLRRGARPDDGDVVVARQQEARVLPLRREPGEGLLPADGSDAACRTRVDIEAYPKAGAPNPIVDLFVYDVASARRRRRSTCATASRSTTPSSATTSTTSQWSPDGTELLLQPHQSPAAHRRVRGLQSGDRRVPRRRPRGVADRLGRHRYGRAPALTPRWLKDGKRFIWEIGAQRLEELLSLRSDAASSSRRSPATAPFEAAHASSRSTRRPASSSTRRATATTT